MPMLDIQSRFKELGRIRTGITETNPKTGRSYPLAITQDHHAIDEAGAEEIQKRVPRLVREGTLQHYRDVGGTTAVDPPIELKHPELVVGEQHAQHAVELAYRQTVGGTTLGHAA